MIFGIPVADLSAVQTSKFTCAEPKLLGTTLAPVRTEPSQKSNDVTNVTSIHVVDLRLKLEQLKTVF